MEVLQYALKKKPIITSITKDADLANALKSSANVAFLLNADIMSLPNLVDKLKTAGKLSFVHLDLMTGIARDASGIKFLANSVGIDGIVTTRTNLISIARQNDLMAIQRAFILDSVSVDQTIKIMQDSRPDALEILPGLVLPYVMHLLHPSRNSPIIAGGLLSTKEHVRDVLDAGCIGISTSSAELWNWQDGGFKNNI